MTEFKHCQICAFKDCKEVTFYDEKAFTCRNYKPKYIFTEVPTKYKPEFVTYADGSTYRRDENLKWERIN